MFPEVYTVAEVGLNYLNFQDAKQSITDAKMAGADAVKFQWFSPHDLYGGKHDKKGDKFKEEWLPELKEKADAVGIHLAVSVFNPRRVKDIDKYVDYHKIAAAEAKWPQLLQACLDTGKKLMVTVGPLVHQEIEEIIKAARRSGLNLKDLCLLYGEPSYPSRYHYLPRIKAMVENYPEVTIGFSDHSTDVIDAPMRAQHYGAQVFEKHFQSIPGKFPDSDHSLTADEFKIMVQSLKRETSAILGRGRDEYVRFYNRRLMATERIEPRDVLRYGKNYEALRVSPDDFPKGDIQGMNPLLFDMVEGQPAKRRINPGDPIFGDNVVLKPRV